MVTKLTELGVMFASYSSFICRHFHKKYLFIKALGHKVGPRDDYITYNNNIIYYCTSGRAVQENIRFKAGSIGPTVGRANTEAENQIFSCTA